MGKQAIEDKYNQLLRYTPGNKGTLHKWYYDAMNALEHQMASAHKENPVAGALQYLGSLASTLHGSDPTAHVSYTGDNQIRQQNEDLQEQLKQSRSDVWSTIQTFREGKEGPQQQARMQAADEYERTHGSIAHGERSQEELEWDKEQREEEARIQAAAAEADKPENIKKRQEEELARAQATANTPKLKAEQERMAKELSSMKEPEDTSPWLNSPEGWGTAEARSFWRKRKMRRQRMCRG